MRDMTSITVLLMRIFIALVSERRAEIDLRYWDFGEIIVLCKIFLKDAGTNTDGET